MSPSNFNNNGNANELNVTSSGEFNVWGNVDYGYGVRPIIKLDGPNHQVTGSAPKEDQHVIE